MNRSSNFQMTLIRSALATITAMLLLSSLVVARDQSADGPADNGIPDEALKSVEQALKPVFETLDPKPKTAFRDKTFSATYLPQTFKIHGRSKSGEIQAEAHDEIGPSYKGFVLKAHLQPKGDVNQAVTPQTIHTPYWLTDLDITPIGKTDKQIYWGLSYGSRTDKELLDKIRAKLKALGQSPDQRQ